MTHNRRRALRQPLSPEHKEAISRRWTPERREAWRQWVLRNQPWKRVKVRKSAEWREHLAGIRKTVDGIKSREVRDEKKALHEAISQCRRALRESGFKCG